ncbi:ABC transporter substrate-binding protein [uncultured Enterovirga sp.]|uniref:ABC transporter substrate-binding protein n=1 Tax=uncultured Enterovirga sp. TaxID=2026352 RepID=UPI0035C9D9C5
MGSGSAEHRSALRRVRNDGVRCRRFGAVAAILLALASPAVAKPSAVSINLCTDQLLVRLADAGQIRGLSPYARDPLRSDAAAEAARFPRLSGTAEEVLAIRPDLVLAGRFTKRATRELLRDKGLRVVEFDAVRSVDEARAQIRQAGRLLGQDDRAEQAVARIDAAVARARRAAAATNVSVLPIQRRGWVSGRDTLTTSLLDLVGLRNAGAALSRGLGRMVDLETVVQLRPDLLLVSSEDGAAEDQGSALLKHPALDRLYPPALRIVLPENFTAYCGGPSLADAIDRLAAEVERLH